MADKKTFSGGRGPLLAIILSTSRKTSLLLKFTAVENQCRAHFQLFVILTFKTKTSRSKSPNNKRRGGSKINLLGYRQQSREGREIIKSESVEDKQATRSYPQKEPQDEIYLSDMHCFSSQSTFKRFTPHIFSHASYLSHSQMIFPEKRQYSRYHEQQHDHHNKKLMDVCARKVDSHTVCDWTGLPISPHVRC